MSDSPDGQIKQVYSCFVSPCWHVYFSARCHFTKPKLSSDVCCACRHEDVCCLTSSYLKVKCVCVQQVEKSKHALPVPHCDAYKMCIPAKQFAKPTWAHMSKIKWGITHQLLKTICHIRKHPCKLLCIWSRNSQNHHMVTITSNGQTTEK